MSYFVRRCCDGIGVCPSFTTYELLGKPGLAFSKQGESGTNGTEATVPQNWSRNSGSLWKRVKTSICKSFEEDIRPESCSIGCDGVDCVF